MNDYVTYVWRIGIIGRVLSPEWHIQSKTHSDNKLVTNFAKGQ